jgi:hypothetical protein
LSHGGITCTCDYVAKAGSLALPRCENGPPSHQKTCDNDEISITLTRCFLHKARRCPQRQQDSLPLTKTPPDTPCAYACVGAVCIVLVPPRAPPKKSTPIFRIVARTIPNCGAATSHRTRTYRFNGDIGHIIIDVSLIRRRVSTRRSSCRPQCIDF